MVALAIFLAVRCTDSDMSSRPLKEKGIYRLVQSEANALSYVRREQKLRTRLFLIKGSRN